MNARTPWLVLLLAALLSAPAFAAKAEDEAGDVSEVDKDASGPLRERIRPVSGHLFLMDGRFEVSPNVGISLRDAFFIKVLFGAAFTYHFSETVALSASGAYTLSLISGNAQICNPPNAANGQPAGCRSPTLAELTQQNGAPANKAFGNTTFMADVDLQWAPLYGKLSLFAENTLHFNMYGLIGPSVVMYGPSNTITVGGNAGIGFRFFINSFVTVRLELRDVIYAENGLEAGLPITSVRNQLMTELGVSFFFPTIFEDK
jgi:outer membrane beta-barrel protein